MLAWPSTGLKRTNFAEAFERWPEAAAEVGEARLLAAVMACVADPEVRRGDHGYPGLHRWLREKRYRAYLPAVGPGAKGSGAPLRAAFAGPPELRASFVAAHGEAAAVSWLDRCGWGEGVLIAANVAAETWLRRNASAWTKQQGLAVARAGVPVGEGA